MKIYIAGKITGLKIETARANFEQAENTILSWGETPVNPMKLPHDHNKQWNSYMAECIEELIKCDAIYLLKNYRQSKGARLELKIAKSLELKTFYQ